MKIATIQKLPTCVEKIPEFSKGVNESCLRSYWILEKAKGYLKRGVPADILIELIDEMENPE